MIEVTTRDTVLDLMKVCFKDGSTKTG